MNKEICDEQLELEAKSGYRPFAIDSGITILPLSELGDREFELLIYQLIKREIKDGLHTNISSDYLPVTLYTVNLFVRVWI